MDWIPPKSPYGLIQEQLYHDPWKLMVSCIFCNLTKRTQAEPILWEFLEKYPDPSKVQEDSEDTISQMLKPIGLNKRRAKTLIRFSKEYLEKEWSSDPRVLYGIGKYASDAYKIFCVGDWRNVQPNDHALNWYHDFLKEKFKEQASA